MYNCCAAPPAEAAVTGLALHCIWAVEAPRDYDVTRRGRREGPWQVAIFSLDGHGLLTDTAGGEWTLSAPSLLVCDLRRLRRYRRGAAGWRFWWFQFSAAGARSLPMRILPLAWDAERESACRDCFRDLSSTRLQRRHVAAARFELLLARCMDEALREEGGTISRIVDEVVVALHAEPGRRWRVGDMAAIAGVGERRLRAAFVAATGRSPKRYHDELRLRLAEQMLAAGIGGVAEVAERLGWSSPFHFSRAFSRHFGLPPSRVAARA